MLKRQMKIFSLGILVIFVLGIGLFASSTQDAEKKYASVVGDYEFDMQGQIMIISFWVEEGKLWGAPEGETPLEVVPVEGEEMKFEVNTAEGQYFELEFVKDEAGKVTKCLLATMGMEVEGVKIK